MLSEIAGLDHEQIDQWCRAGAFGPRSSRNTNPLHFNEPYAERMPTGRVLVNSGLTFAMVLGMSVQDISENAIANLGWNEIKLVQPCSRWRHALGRQQGP